MKMKETPLNAGFSLYLPIVANCHPGGSRSKLASLHGANSEKATVYPHRRTTIQSVTIFNLVR